jgi:hypothetical protein
MAGPQLDAGIRDNYRRGLVADFSLDATAE